MEGEQPQLGDLLTMVANYLLNGMILQVGDSLATHGLDYVAPHQHENWRACRRHHRHHHLNEKDKTKRGERAF